jgi:hypothetical protein
MPHNFNANEAPEEGRAEFPKFELAKDEVARINLLSIKGWTTTVRHWVSRMGYVHCHASENLKPGEDLLTEMLKIEEEGGRPEECLMCKLSVEGNTNVGAPLRRFAARVLRYKTDTKGEVPRSGDLAFWLEIWLFDNRKYRKLNQIMREWGGDELIGISQHDISITCDDQKYQNMTFQPMKNALWKAKEKEVIAYFKEEAVKYDLGVCLGNVIEPTALERRFAQIERRAKTEDPVDFPYGGKPDSEPVGGESVSEAASDPFDLADKSPDGKIPEVEPSEESADGATLLDELLTKS